MHRGFGNLHNKPLLEGVGMIWGVACGNGWCRLEVMQLKWRDYGARRSPVNQPRRAPTWRETGRVSNCCPTGSAGGRVRLVLRSVVSTVTARGFAIGCRPKVCSWIGWPSSGAAPWGQRPPPTPRLQIRNPQQQALKNRAGVGDPPFWSISGGAGTEAPQTPQNQLSAQPKQRKAHPDDL